jgi:hypothetical protein
VSDLKCRQSSFHHIVSYQLEKDLSSKLHFMTSHHQLFDLLRFIVSCCLLSYHFLIFEKYFEDAFFYQHIFQMKSNRLQFFLIFTAELICFLLYY